MINMRFKIPDPMTQTYVLVVLALKGRVKCQNVIFSLFCNFDLLPPMFGKICLAIMSTCKS